MEFGLIEAAGSLGIIGSAFLFMIWASNKEKNRLMDFIEKQGDRLESQQKELNKISTTLTMIIEDLRDVRRKIGLKEEK